ncbi:hypothetical protein GGI25_004857 [Coemansia spiralis]|uniref:Globin-sensor domain-containing protein n=2 Tax=Coemansia TaxID=4863 RepID=A0A9W8G498_9FUNG|nr:Protoglobin-domain-containing protein [Coemansia spiralis]KAJ1991926.1 hypothetical protein EDC05_003080 [Coemansia umbellata]KAJ2625297.1 hypothetical protein GGI26_000767 [Coemansia sp. RSA 1358]KAJ2673042.1 hypothetical protein GGI25_004857 [Coemansia spiralis]
MSQPKPKPIDHDRLYTDLQYRYEYVSEFIGFGVKDHDAIHKSADYISGLIPACVDAVYDKLFNYDLTWEHFSKDQEGFEVRDKRGKEVTSVDKDSEVIVFRKTMLTKYLRKLVTAEWNLSYVKYLDWVGHIHTSTPMKRSTINVEYIHCNALFGYLSGMIVDALQKNTDWDDDTRNAIIQAYIKFFWIQNDLFSRYYVKDRVLTEKEKAAVAVEKAAKEDTIRRELRTESLLNAVYGTAAGIVVGAIASKYFGN